MAQRPPKEPWNDEIYDRKKRNESAKRGKDDKGKKHKEGNGQASTIYLTVLVVLMFIIIAAAIVFAIWNTRNTNMNTVENQFYPKASSSTAIVQATSAETTETTSSSSDSSGSTYTIVAGDYPALIAQKVSQQLGTTVTWDDIVALNGKDSSGTAGQKGGLNASQPGYYNNGNQLSAGDTLVIKK
ncbi:MAG: LysM peptidoglycan-binding domain-containing protein [Streptococcaceae bacterium]|jgi:cytoskeletal protein RodZ|nr:LysM peptidoglycan-binding domain-containing protein [Streptococcaceae bacterium]